MSLDILDQLSKFLDAQNPGAVIDVMGSDCLLVMSREDFENVIRLAQAARNIHTGKVTVIDTQTGRVSANTPNPSVAPATTPAAPVKKEAVRHRVWSYIRSCGAQGATCDEVEAALGLPHQSVSARIYDLEKANVLVDCGDRRKTRSGRKARVLMTRVAFAAASIPTATSTPTPTTQPSMVAIPPGPPLGIPPEPLSASVYLKVD